MFDFGFFSKGTHLGYFLMHVTGIAEKRLLRCGSHKRVGQELFITSHGGVSQSTLTLLGLIHFFKKYAAQNRHVETSHATKSPPQLIRSLLTGLYFLDVSTHGT